MEKVRRKKEHLLLNLPTKVFFSTAVVRIIPLPLYLDPSSISPIIKYLHRAPKKKKKKVALRRTNVLLIQLPLRLST
jgi:thioredoxin-related protein